MDELRLAPYVLYSSLDYPIAINFFNMSGYGRCGGERGRLKDWVLMRSGSGYPLFAAVHYMAVELDGDGRVECEGCTYTHNKYLHLPPLVTIYFL